MDKFSPTGLNKSQIVGENHKNHAVIYWVAITLEAMETPLRYIHGRILHLDWLENWLRHSHSLKWLWDIMSTDKMLTAKMSNRQNVNRQNTDRKQTKCRFFFELSIKVIEN